MINWNVRLRNKKFVLAIISAIILLVQAVGKMFGLHLNLSNLSDNIVDVVNSMFGILAVLGVVVDPTTHGISDSDRALGYDSPKKDNYK